MLSTPCPRCRQAAPDLHLAAFGLCAACEPLLEDDRRRARSKAYDLCEYGFISPSQRDRLCDVIDDPSKGRTADRKPIRFGALYIDYDLRPTVVTGIQDVSLDGRETNGAAIWWRTSTGMFDGTRLAYRKP